MRSTGLVTLLVLGVGTLAAAGRAEEARTVTAGPQYAAGPFHEFWFGKGYRDLWTTPIQAPVLDLTTTGGGLTPVRVVGQAQSLGLALRGADGRAYTFRSLHKHPERMLPAAWRDRWPAKVAQDQTSGTHPAAAIILAPLAEAAGVAHTAPRLVVMPDDPALGEFRETFANEFGTIDVFPLPVGDGNPGFMGATEMLSTEKLWERWLAGPENRIDSRAFLRARVVDLWLDNFDRHRGQWRWMRIPGEELLQPLPEDPDMVLVHHDGRVMSSLRNHIPRLLKFTPGYSRRLEGPLMNSFEVDRWLLSDLDAAAWEEVARDVQARLTDEIIEDAIRQMPPEWFAIDGAKEVAALKTRRAGLVDYVLRVYRYYARKVDVHATDQAERVTVARGPDDAVEVTIALIEGDAAPWYRRRFLPDETGEVRLYLHGGNDRVTRTGPAAGPILVRAIAGGGTDVVDDSRSGGTDVWRDAGTVEVDRGRGTHVRERIWTNPAPVEDAPWLEPRSFGHFTTTGAVVAYHPDIQAVLGYGFTRTAWGFRTEPASSVQTVRGALATGPQTGKIEYGGTFRRPASRLALRLEAFASDIEQFNYFGYGNDSLNPPSFITYRAEEKVLFASPTVRYEMGKRFEAHVGPEVRYSETPDNPDSTIGIGEAYGTGRFGQIALRGGLRFDSRERPDTSAAMNIAEGLSDAPGNGPVTGVNLQADAFFMPPAWSVTSSYGGVDGILTAYLGSSRAHVAFRVGGRTLWGEAPWFEGAAIGGFNNRGFRSRRFLGESSLFGSVSLRGWLGNVPFLIVPLRLGLVAFGDVGRVWHDPDFSNTWHTSLGGGLLLRPLGAPVTLHGIAANSDEGTRFYFGFGYPF